MNEHLTIRSDQWLAAGVLELGGTFIAGARKTSTALAIAQAVVDRGRPVVYVTDNVYVNERPDFPFNPSLLYQVDWIDKGLLDFVTEVRPALLVFDVGVSDPGLAGEFPLAAICAATDVDATIVATAYLSKH